MQEVLVESTEPGWALRSEAELIADQLAGIDSWTATLGAGAAASVSAAISREMRLDLRRRMEIRRREQAALLARAALQLEQGGRLLRRREHPRALLVHRNAWLCGRVADRLTEHGVEVLARCEDGADASGTLVVEQPELAFIEDRLPTLSGLELLHRAARFAPHTVVGAQLADTDELDAYLEAGAGAVFTRRIPPVDIADQLVGCLSGRAGQVTLV